MRPSPFYLSFSLPVLILAAGFFASHEAFADTARPSGDDQALRVFLDKVYQTMDEHYYLPVSEQAYRDFLKNYPAKRLKKLNEKSKKTPNYMHLGAGLLVNQLKSPSDTFTNFVPPEKSKEFKEKAYAVTEDLGLEIKKLPIGYQITKVQKHCQAFEKSVRAGDILLAIDGKDLKSLDLETVKKMLSPAVGTMTRLDILSTAAGRVLQISLESKSYFRETVERLESPKPDTVILKLSHFNQMTGPDFGDELSGIQMSQIKKVILDLRDNGGGPPLAAREILGYFTPPNDFLFAIARKKQRPVMLSSPPQPVLYNGKLDILVNEKTGSAAEMFSGVLQSKGLAKLIGQKTAGATYLKSIYDFEDKSMIFMITSLTFFPDKRVFPKDGLTPDFNLDPATDALRYAIQNT